jgi:hypothetical protein
MFVWILSFSSSLSTLVLVLSQNFLFAPILGLVAFDYPNYKKIWGDQFEWKKFARFGDMPSLTAFTSVLLTGIGFLISSLVTGQYKEIISLLLKTALPQLPGGQAPH